MPPTSAPKSKYWPTKEKPFRYFVGWDSHEAIAHDICVFSCLQQASVPVEIHKLQHWPLRARGVYWRKRDPKQSTEFTYLRFLVPHLAGYSGWALFTDDDFMWRCDIAELLENMDDSKAIMCVKHKVQASCTQKLAGVPQENYPCKNWSSCMLINCDHPDVKKLTPAVVCSETPQFLHRFNFVTDRDDIGEYSYEFNWLADWYDQKEHKPAKVVHWTDGGPYYPDYRERGTDYQDEWFEWLKKFEAQLPEPRMLYPYERFSTKEPPSKPLPGYKNSDAGRWTWKDDDEWQEYVKEHFIPKEIAEAKKLGEANGDCLLEKKAEGEANGAEPATKKVKT